MSLIWYVSFKYLFILKINYSWKIKISSYGIVLTFMLHAQILLKQQFQPRQSHWCQAQIGLIFSPLICIYVELWNMLVKGWVQKNDFSTWRIVSYAWSLSTSYYLLILKWKKMKRYCFLVEKVLLFIKKYCRKKVLSKGIRPLDTVKVWKCKKNVNFWLIFHLLSNSKNLAFQKDPTLRFWVKAYLSRNIFWRWNPLSDL